MAESLSAEQIEERRKNLAFIRENMPSDPDGDHMFTTTLLMQEEWLATVDELQTYVRDAHIIRGLRTQKCLGPTGGLALACEDCYEHLADYCAPCYLRAIHLTPEMLQGIREGVKAVKEGRIRPWSEVGAELFENEPLPVTSAEAEEGTPREQSEEEAWREQFENTPPTGIIGLHTDPEDPRNATPEEFENECGIAGQGHVWVKMGTVGLRGLSGMEWGDTKCLRCGIPVPVPDFDELEPGRECCWEHDCPHHNGMKQNVSGQWYNPFYHCFIGLPCTGADCPHTVGMRRDGNDEWYDPNDPTDGRYRPDR